ncbi:MAG: hypothetical protein ACM3QZ_00350 [Solirubrobacterales bacterium]
MNRLERGFVQQQEILRLMIDIIDLHRRALESVSPESMLDMLKNNRPS